jgi:hypothetical protein
VAIASDTPLPQVTLPVIDLNDIERIVDALLEYAAPLPLSVSVLRSA